MTDTPVDLFIEIDQLVARLEEDFPLSWCLRHSKNTWS